MNDFQVAVRIPRSAQDMLLCNLIPAAQALVSGGSRMVFVREHDFLRFRLRGTPDAIEEFRRALSEQLVDGKFSTVEVAGEIDLADTLSGPGAVEFVDEFLGSATLLLLDGIAAADGAPSIRLAFALDLVAAQVRAVSSTGLFGTRYGARLAEYDVPLGFGTLRSHVDGFFIMSKDPDAARTAMANRYRATAERINARVSAVLAQLGGDGPEVSEIARTWSELVRPRLFLADAGLRSGELVLGTADADPGSGYLGDEQDISVSRFHQLVQTDPEFQRFMRSDPGFGAMRVMMSLLYLALHCLGLPLIERYFLCYAVSRACETAFGITAEDVLASVVGTDPAR